jgi:hypothetical protein
MVVSYIHLISWRMKSVFYERQHASEATGIASEIEGAAFALASVTSSSAVA